jgi:predicted alpha/beta-hydrolase family hydrolase
MGVPSAIRPLLLFAPGAGAPSTSPWMERWAERLGELGQVVRLDYPYRLAGRRNPDRLPVLVAAHRAALGDARRRHPGPAFLVGKSMGGRIGCHVALDEEVAGLVCLGYPLRGQRGQLRDEVLIALARPVLFVQGSRDPLCPLDLLEQTRARMAAPSSLHVVEGGNHSLEVGVRALAKRGESQAQVDAAVLAAIAAFLLSSRTPAPRGR